MDYFSCPLSLISGATITVQAWSMLHFAAQYQDFRNLLNAFAERAGGRTGDTNQQLLIDRVLVAAVPLEQDRNAITAGDFAELIETIAQLNRVEEIAGKALDLQQRLLQAEQRALSAVESPEVPVTSSG